MVTAGGRSLDRRAETGQGLAELALIVPVVLLLTLIAIDFGRVYLGWVNLQNVAGIAAGYAADHPAAWTGGGDAALQAAYQARIRADATATNCTLPIVGGQPTAPAPTFPGGTALGGTASVALDCTFRLITPFLGRLLGGDGAITVSASAVFPIRAGVAGAGSGGSGGPPAPVAAFSVDPETGGPPLTVTITDLSSGDLTGWSWSFGDGATASGADPAPHVFAASGTYVIGLTVTDSSGRTDSTSQTVTVTVTPPSVCTVPDFIGTSNDAAAGVWAAANFTSTMSFSPAGGTWPIKKQSLVAGSSVPCDSAITVYKKA